METKIFNVEGKEIEVKVDYENKQVWLSQRGISDLYGKSVKTINRHISTIISTSISKNEKDVRILDEVLEDGRVFKISYYDIDMILQVGYKCNPQVAMLFKEWVDALFKEDNDINILNNWLNGAKTFEIVRFESGEISLDVNVSPEENTVWLTQSDMSLLFGVTIPNISQHITNIFDLNELDNSSVIKKNLTTASDGKTYNVTYYSLDVVLAVGYRVNSKRGIEFRRWATSILKQYLIKGYAINTKRCMEHSDIIVSLTNDINLINTKLSNINDKIEDHDIKLNAINASEVLTDGTLVYEGNVYKTYSFIRDLLLKAKNRVIIVDGYVDYSVLDMLDDIKVDIIIYTYPGAPLKKIDIDKFSVNHNLSVIRQTSIHSRYIIIDDIIYSISESIKDAGKKRFVSQIIDIITVEELLYRLH